MHCILDYLCHVLFCKRLNDFHYDCVLCSKVVITNEFLTAHLTENFKSVNINNIQYLKKMTIFFIDSGINRYNLDIYFPSNCFVSVAKRSKNYCLFLESCNSPADLVKLFCQVMMQIHFNSMYECFSFFPDFSSYFFKKYFKDTSTFLQILLLNYVNLPF